MNIEHDAEANENFYKNRLENALKNIKEVLNIDVSKQDSQYPFMLKGAIIGYEGTVAEIKDKFRLDATAEFPEIAKQYQELFPHIEEYVDEVREIFGSIK